MKTSNESIRPTFAYNHVSFSQQLRALLLRNLLIKWRQRGTFLMEILFPFFFIIIQFAEPHQRHVLQAQNEPSIEGNLYPSNTWSDVSMLKDATWNVVNSGVLDEVQLHRFSTLIQETGKIVCGTKRCSNRINLDTTFSSESDFNEFNANNANSTTVHLAIILHSLNDSGAKYAIRFPYESVPSSQEHTEFELCHSFQAQTCPSFLYRSKQFSLVQAIVDSAILSFKLGPNHLIPNFKIGIFPRAKQVDDTDVKKIAVIIPVSFITFISFTAVQLVKEKEKRIKDALFMMGLNPATYWFSWALVQGLITVPTSLAWTMFLYYYNLAAINPFLLYCFIQFAAYSFTLFAFLISPFFSHTKIVQAVSAILAMVMAGLPYFVRTAAGSSSSLFKIFSFISSFPFTGSLSAMFSSDQYITFSNMFSVLDFSIGFSLIAIIIDCILYFGFALIFDYIICNNILSSLLNSVMANSKSASNEYDLTEGPLSISNVEPITADFQNNKAIEIVNIVKKFDSKVAINGISLDLYQSQITAFLGPNGAGKTTLINMLIGELRPTSGKVLIYGHHVQSPSDLQLLRTNFGVCLQEDVLCEELTPVEHLRFVAEMKGLLGEELTDEVQHMLVLMDLNEQKDTPAVHLSGGQKRKLCIAMAVIAHSKIIFLDEPTSGVDVYSRRKIWTVLQSLKKGRVIILTTHLMDEADILSDRKAFIVNGKVHCAGSSLFLKSKFGVGYHLRIDIHSKENMPHITDLVCRSIPSAQLNRATNSEMIFTLPKHETSNFPSLFQSLDKSIERNVLGLKDYGITVTSLEDVFLNICQHEDAAHETRNECTNGSSSISSNEVNTVDLKTVQYTVDCASILLYFVKIRWLILLRERSFLYVFITNAILALVFAKISMISQDEFQVRPLSLSTDLYSQDVLLYKANASFGAVISSSLTKYCKPKPVSVLNWSTMKKAIYAIDSTSSSTIAAIFFKVSHLHALPILQNLVSNLLAEQWLHEPFHIETISFPLPETTQHFSLQAFGYIILLASLYCSIPCTFAAEVVEDRETKVKAYLNACGMSPLQYWCSLLLVHGPIFALVCLAATVLSVSVFSLTSLLADWQFWLCLIATNVLFVPSALLLCYVLSFLFTSKETAQSALYYITLIPTSILTSVLIVLSIYPVQFAPLGTVSFFMCLLWPFATPFVCLFSLLSLSQQRSHLVDISYFEWNQTLLPNIIALIIAPVMYSLLLYFVDRTNFITIWRYLCQSKKQTIPAVKQDDLDPDVQLEKCRVDKIYPNIACGAKAPLLLIKDLTKAFNDKIAVNSLSLTVESGQIVGLLGSNGAGKTTTMRILVGDELKTSGIVLIDGAQMEADTDRTALLSYCPQDNPLWKEITLEEHLQLFSAIRGVPYDQISTFCNSLLKLFDIEEHASKQSNCLSGGTKRKLCLLISILGTAKLVLMDEPTSGMDPKSKRLVWNIVISNFEPNGEKSAILSSHSMEEVDALCTRMAIMMKGTPQCLGTIQHLKNKFGSGYILEVSFKPHRDLDCDRIQALVREQLFPNVKVLEQLNNNIKLEVSQSDIHSLALVFQTLQGWLQEYPDIEEYSFCQSSIERVFIGFAEKDNLCD